MKKIATLLFTLLIIVGLAAPTQAAATWVQGVACNGTLSRVTTQQTCRLPNNVISGNTILIGVNNNTGASPSSVTDDQGNTYTGIAAKASGQQINVYCLTNITNTPKNIIVNYGGAGKNFIGLHVAEFFNVTSCTPTVTVTTNSGAGTSATAGSFSPTSGDLIVNYILQDSTAPMSSWTLGAGFTWSTARNLDISDAIQFRVAPGGAINPTATLSTSRSWMSVAVSLPSGSQGSAPSSVFRVLRYQNDNIQSSLNASPHLVQFPCSGNLIVMPWQGAPGRHVTGITDSKSNTWTNADTGTGYAQSGGSGVAQGWYAANPTCGMDLVLTVTWDGGDCSGGCMVGFFDITGAAVAPYDTFVAATGTAAATTFLGGSITPSTTTGMVINILAIQSNTTIGSSPARFLSPTSAAEISPWPAGENNGIGLTYLASGAQQQTWTTDIAAAGWGEENIAFKAAAAAPTLTSINPTSGAQSTAPSVSFVGTNFDGGNVTVNISGAGVTAGTPSGVTNTAMTSVFTIAAGAATTARDVTVTTDGGTTAAQTFTVTAASSAAGTMMMMGIGK